MNLEAALRSHLLTIPELTALVGTRVYAMTLPQPATMPSVVYRRISTQVLEHRTGSTYGRVRMQVDGIASSYAGAAALRDIIRRALEVFKPASSPRVDRTQLQDGRDLNDPETNRFRVSLDFIIWCDE